MNVLINYCYFLKKKLNMLEKCWKKLKNG